jgi:ornithine--oxo-acid transaminase
VCDRARVLFVADEVQSGLGRTGHLLATRGAGTDADVYLLGKALGGGILPLSAVVADDEVLGVLRPGQHGSTFGGNPLACAVGRAVLALLADTGPHGMLAAARRLGDVLHARLAALVGHGVVAVRGTGLWAGVDVDPRLGSGRAVSEALARRGVLVKDTHGATIRFSPPLVVTEEEIGFAVDALGEVLAPLR